MTTKKASAGRKTAKPKKPQPLSTQERKTLSRILAKARAAKAYKNARA